MNPEPWTWTRTDFDSLSCKVGERVEVSTVGDHKLTGTLVSVSRLAVASMQDAIGQVGSKTHRH